MSSRTSTPAERAVVTFATLITAYAAEHTARAAYVALADTGEAAALEAAVALQDAEQASRDAETAHDAARAERAAFVGYARLDARVTV